MIVIGVTGPIASGKSTVDAMLADLGAAPIIDADKVVHLLLDGSIAESAAVIDQVVRRFGPDVLRSGSSTGGRIDRSVLGRLVFGDPIALADLEKIIHPAVRAHIAARVAAAPANATVVIDAVKLFPGPLEHSCTARWWVSAPVEQQRQRLIALRGLSPQDADRRLAAQQSLADWRDKVDAVIDNSGTLEQTRQQVQAAWAKVRRSTQG